MRGHRTAGSDYYIDTSFVEPFVYAMLSIPLDTFWRNTCDRSLLKILDPSSCQPAFM